MRLLLAKRALDPSRAWRLAQSAAADSDATVLLASVGLLAMFDLDHADPALAALEKDADATVAAEAKRVRYGLKQYKNFNPDRPY